MTDQGAATQILENKDLLIKVSPKGGLLELVRLKDYTITLINPWNWSKKETLNSMFSSPPKTVEDSIPKIFIFSSTKFKNGKQTLS